MIPFTYLPPVGTAAETADVGQSIGIITLVDGNGNPDDGGTISFRLSEPPSGDGVSYSRTAWTATADSDGIVPIDDRTFISGARYIGRRSGGPEVGFLVPEDSPFDLPTTLSRATPL